MAQNEYEIQIDLRADKQTVWKTITDFKSYPRWNSMLEMTDNDQLEVGRKFRVTIIEENGGKSKFGAETLSRDEFQSFSAQQVILAPWFFSATHYFILEEKGEGTLKFIQRWKLTGILSTLLRKQIFRQLALFNRMNIDLKKYLDESLVPVSR